MGPTGQQFPLKRTVGTVRQLGRVLRIFADQGVERSKGTEPAMSSSLGFFQNLLKVRAYCWSTQADSCLHDTGSGAPRSPSLTPSLRRFLLKVTNPTAVRAVLARAARQAATKMMHRRSHRVCRGSPGARRESGRIQVEWNCIFSGHRSGWRDIGRGQPVHHRLHVAARRTTDKTNVT
jgi:hypothetical protein